MAITHLPNVEMHFCYGLIVYPPPRPDMNIFMSKLTVPENMTFFGNRITDIISCLDEVTVGLLCWSSG